MVEIGGANYHLEIYESFAHTTIQYKNKRSKQFNLEIKESNLTHEWKKCNCLQTY